MHCLAIMQPYLFPYIGYWQLMKAVDRFVIYDDVNYIKGGWINRNRILIQGAPAYMTIPLVQASPNMTIQTLRMQSGTRWRDKLTRMLALTYARSPHFELVWPTLTRIIDYDTDDLVAFLTNQIQVLAQCLGLSTVFERASLSYPRHRASGQARVIDICVQAGATQYINALGGRSLYDKATFAARGVDLRFLACRMPPYSQRSDTFVPQLSIIDTLMALGVQATAHCLDAYDLIDPAPLPLAYDAA